MVRSNVLAGIRVAVLNWRDPWQAAAGGAEQYAYRVSLELIAAGARVDFLTSRAAGQPRADDRDGVRWLRRGGRWTVYPAVFVRLAATRRRYDAVLDCQNGIPFFAPLAVGRRGVVVLVVHHVHDVQFGLHFPAPVAAFGRWLEGPVSRWVYRRATAVAVSASTVSAMRERLRWRGRIVIVPNGVTVTEVGAGCRSPLPRVVAVGRLVRHKRVEQVVALGAGTGEVHVIGTGPEEAAIRRLAVGTATEVHGFLPAGAKDALVASAWLHVSASVGEGWGLSVMEAAALGVPSVAYDVDGLRDAVDDGKTGWLVRGDEAFADVVAHALGELACGERAREVARACRERARMFDWRDSGARVAALIRRELDAAAR